MISQELMLGDLVMLNPDLKEYYPFAGKPCMVIGLHDDDGAIKIEYDNGKYFWTDAEDDVISIPLTPEILEKSGLEHNKGEMYYHGKLMYHHESKYVSICYGANNYWHLHINNGCDFSKAIKYVHELQHALKLCGIDKTIEL